MQEQNKKHQKTMRTIQAEDEFDLNFIPNVGVGDLLFEMSEKELLELLAMKGNINFERQVYNNGEDDKSISYRFKLNMNTITVFFNYEEENNYVSIHMNNMEINEIGLSTMNINKLRFYLKEFHKSLHLEYVEKFEDNKVDVSYSFDKIGLTVWFEDEEVSDICINPVILGSGSEVGNDSEMLKQEE